MELSQVLQALRNADAAGDVEAARRLAQIARDLQGGKKESGIAASAKRGLAGLLSQGYTGIDALTGDADEAGREGLARGADTDRRYEGQVGTDRVKAAYGKDGVLGAAGEVVRQVPHALAEQAPNIATTLGAARLGALAGSVAGPAGAVVGGVAGAVAPSLLQQFGGNVERQAAEGQRVDVGKAGAAAVPQAAMDAAATFIPLGGRIVSKLTGIPERALVGRTIEQAERLANERLSATIAKGGITALAAEVPTEIAQTMLERAQAGLPLAGEDAYREYGEVAYQAGLLSPIGAVGRFSEKGGARQQVQQHEDQARADALREQEEQQKAAQVQQQVAGAPAAPGQPPAPAQPPERQYSDLTGDQPAQTLPFHVEPQGTLPGMEAAPAGVPTPPEADPQRALRQLAAQKREIEQLRIDHQQQEADAAGAGDIAKLRALRKHRAALELEYKHLNEKIDLLGGEGQLGGVNAEAKAKELEKARSDLQRLSGAAYDPAKADKLLEKIERLEQELAGAQTALGLPKPSRSQSIEGWTEYGQRTGLGDRMYEGHVEAINERKRVEGEVEGVRRLADKAKTPEYAGQARREYQQEVATRKEIEGIERQARMPTGVSEQGQLFGNELTGNIRQGTAQAANTAKTRAQLLADLDIARAARNAVPGQRNPRATERISQIIEQLRDLNVREAQQAEARQSDTTLQENAGMRVPEREQQVAGLRDRREGAYAYMVKTLEKFNRGLAKREEMETARDAVVDSLIQEAELARGRPLDDGERFEAKKDAHQLLRDLIMRWGDTRSDINVGTSKDPELIPAQYSDGKFNTNEGGFGTGPFGMGLTNVETREPGKQTFGSAPPRYVEQDPPPPDLAFAGHPANQERVARALSAIKDFLRKNPGVREALADASDRVNVFVVGGVADPARNGQDRKDLDLMIGEGYREDGLIEPEVLNGLRALQGYINSAEVNRNRYDMQAMLGEPDGTGPTHDLSDAVRALLRPNKVAVNKPIDRTVFAETIREGLDEIRNRLAGTGGQQAVDREITPPKVTGARFAQQVERLRPSLDAAGNKLADRALDLKVDGPVLEDISLALHRAATTGKLEVDERIEQTLKTMEEGRRSESEQPTKMVAGDKTRPAGAANEVRSYSAQPDGEVRTAAQGDLFPESVGTTFASGADFQSYLAGEGLAAIRRAQNLPGETASRVQQLVDALNEKIANFQTLLQRRQQQWENSQRAKKEVQGMQAQAEAERDAKARRQAESARKLVLAALNKLDAELRKHQIAFIRASLRHTFTQRVVDDLNAQIDANMGQFGAPIKGLWLRYSKEMDASRNAIRAEIRSIFSKRAKKDSEGKLPSTNEGKYGLATGWTTEKKGTPFWRAEMDPPQNVITPRLQHLMELHNDVLFKRGVLGKRMNEFMPDDRMRAFWEEDQKLHQQLADEVKALANAQGQLTRAGNALLAAHTDALNEPGRLDDIKKREALYAEAQRRLMADTPDMAAARELLGEQDATIKAVEAELKALSDGIQFRKGLAEGMQRAVRERAEARTKTREETQADREDQDRAARKEQNERDERVVNTPNRTRVSFEPARRLEEARERATKRVAALEEQEATGTPEERAAATEELARRRARVQQLTAGAEQKLQNSIANAARLEKKVEELTEQVAGSGLTKKQAHRLEGTRRRIAAKEARLATVTDKALVASLKEQIAADRAVVAELEKIAADKIAEHTADLEAAKKALSDTNARISVRRGNERIPILTPAQRKAQSAEQPAAEAGERLPARRIGPVVKKAQQAGNIRTGDTTTTEERIVGVRNPIQQSGNAKGPTATQAIRAANKDSVGYWLGEQERLTTLKEKVEEALEKATEAKDATAIANRTEQLARVTKALASAEANVNRNIATTRLANIDEESADDLDPVKLWKEKPAPAPEKKAEEKKAEEKKPEPPPTPPKQTPPAAWIEQAYDGDLDENAPFHGMTFADAARYGAQRTNSPLVASFFLKLAETFDTAPPDQQGRVYAVAAPLRGRTDASKGKETTSLGIYNVYRNEVYSLTPGYRTGTNKVLLHELAHAATVRALYVNPELAGRVRELRDQVLAWLETAEGKAYFRKSAGNLGKSRSEIYGLKNEREFIAELFANRGFQLMLSQIKSKQPKKSIFTKFVELLAGFFGGKGEIGNSVFAEAVALTEEVLDFTRTEIHGKDAWNKRKAGFKALGDDHYAPTYAKGWRDVGAITDRIVAKDKPFHEKVRAHGSGLAFETRLVDRFAGLERMSKQMDSLAGTQMMFFARMFDQRFHHVSQSVGVGVTQLVEKSRADGRKEFVLESKPGASLRSVVTALQPAAKKMGGADAAGRIFTLYMSAKRAKSKGLAALNLDGLVTKADLDAAESAVHGDPVVKEAFERARREYNQYNRDLLKLLTDSGVIHKDIAAKLLKEDDYIPWYRQQGGDAVIQIGSETPITLGSLKHQPHLQELIGGNKPILDFLTSSVQNTNMIIDMSLRNLATKSAVFELVEIGAAKIMGAQAAGNDVVQFFHEGREKFARIDTDTKGVPAALLVEGMAGIPTQPTGILKALGVPAKVLRKAVTSTPLYAARQLFRDSLAAPILTGADMTPVLGALGQIGKRDSNPLSARGVVGGQVFTGTQEDMSRILRDVAGGKQGWLTSLAKWEAITMEADALTRRAQYDSYRRQGLSEMEATLMALESMNFTKRGSSPSIHMANTIIPFFNAQIQGLNVMWKAATGKLPFSERLKIQEKLFTRGALLAAFSVAYAAAMQDDEAYQNANPDQKYGNWFLRLPGVDEPLKIPVPFEIGYVFKALPEALYNSLHNEHGGEEAVKAFTQILKNTIPGGSNMPTIGKVPVPIPLPQAMKPVIEVGLGKSFFTGRDILTPREQRLSPEAQYRPGTSELAKWLGQTTGVSPVKLEHAVSGYTGALGLALLQAVSMPLPAREAPENATPRLSEGKLFGGAFQPNDAGGIINGTYEQMLGYKETQATVQELVRRGETSNAMALLENKSTEYAKAQMTDRFTGTMQKIARAEAAVRASDMSPDEKRAMLDDIRKAKIGFAKAMREVDDRTTPQ